MMWYLISIVCVLSVPLTTGKGLLERPGLYKLTAPLFHGECPTWDSRTNLLYFVDILLGKIYSYNYGTEEIKAITLDGFVAPVVPSAADPSVLIAGLNRSLIAVKWYQETGNFTTKVLTTVSEDYPNSTFNDGKADSSGAVWFGTIGAENQGKLYKFTKNRQEPEVMISPVTISNGLTWSLKNDRFYYIDSPTLKIFEYDYNAGDGSINNQRVVLNLAEFGISAHPDGMTIDKDGNLWVALYGGGSVIKVDPGKDVILERHPIPASCVTSVMWGGANLDVLFVTTSRKSLSEEEAKREPGAGSLYALTNLGTHGVKVYNADIV